MVNADQSPLRRLREASGLSVRDIERITGINRGRLSTIERGFSADEWERITKALTEALKAR